jgi:molecular chaperone DnaK
MQILWYSRQRRLWKKLATRLIPAIRLQFEADLNALKEAINRAPKSKPETTDAQVEEIKAGKEKLMAERTETLFAKVYEAESGRVQQGLRAQVLIWAVQEMPEQTGADDVIDA